MVAGAGGESATNIAMINDQLTGEGLKESSISVVEMPKLKVTYIVVDILTANMEQGASKVDISHLKRIIKAPQSCTETVTETRETPTRGSVGLKHHERLSYRLCITSGIYVR